MLHNWLKWVFYLLGRYSTIKVGASWKRQVRQLYIDLVLGPPFFGTGSCWSESHIHEDYLDIHEEKYL